MKDYNKYLLGCPERIELSISAPQAEVLPLNYGHHVTILIEPNEV